MERWGLSEMAPAEPVSQWMAEAREGWGQWRPRPFLHRKAPRSDHLESTVLSRHQSCGDANLSSCTLFYSASWYSRRKGSTNTVLPASAFCNNHPVEARSGRSWNRAAWRSGLTLLWAHYQRLPAASGPHFFSPLFALLLCFYHPSQEESAPGLHQVSGPDHGPPGLRQVNRLLISCFLRAF